MFSTKLRWKVMECGLYSFHVHVTVALLHVISERNQKIILVTPSDSSTMSVRKRQEVACYFLCFPRSYVEKLWNDDYIHFTFTSLIYYYTSLEMETRKYYWLRYFFTFFHWVCYEVTGRASLFHLFFRSWTISLTQETDKTHVAWRTQYIPSPNERWWKREGRQHFWADHNLGTTSENKSEGYIHTYASIYISITYIHMHT